MIGKIKGIIDQVHLDYLIIDVNGIGYLVFCPTNLLSKSETQKGNKTELLIETHVREDHIHLYGFATEIEKFWFNKLCSINGVGTKVALKIIGSLTIDEIFLAVNADDKNMFRRVQGVGEKLAAKIITELKYKKTDMEKSGITLKTGANPIKNSVFGDAVLALESLGYSKSAIFNVVNSIIDENPEITIEQLITQSLKKL